MGPRSLFLLPVFLLGVGGLMPLLADSVYVSAYSYPDAYTPGSPFTSGHTQCAQSGTSSASCEAYFSSIYSSRIGGYASANASTSFGALFGQVNTVDFDSRSRAVASFSDNVVVTGGTGTGTLISHYTVALAAESNDASQDAGGFAFVQGATRSSVTPTQFANFGFEPPYTSPPPPGCEYVGVCFSESFDVSSDIAFGTALPLGALSYVNSEGFGQIQVSGGHYALNNADSLLRLDGYSVLDAAGNVVSNAVVTRENLPASFNLDFTPEPGTWGLMLMGLAGLVMWRWRRKAVLPILGLMALCGVGPARANSVSVTNFAPNGSQYPNIIVDGTTVPYCYQSSSSSASCMTSFGGHGGGYGYIDAGGSISASAAFGSLQGQIQEDRSNGYLVASFGDQIVATGGAGAGTLVAHYSLVSEGAAQGPGQAIFTFVQGSTKTSVDAAGNYVVNTGPLPTPPASPYCQSLGYCFAESFDVRSPMQFGADLPLGAQMYVTSPDGTFFPPNGGVTGNASVDLTGYTVLDGAGNVVSDAVVTQQNTPGLNLDFTPEPRTWGLMLMGLAGLVMWRWRRAFGCC